MARTTEDIKKVITEEFMNNEAMADLYGFPLGTDFDLYFSRVSSLSEIFYLSAYNDRQIELLQDAHAVEIAQLADILKPHTLSWYKNKALAFMADTELVPDMDYYDASAMTEDEIAEKRVVKYAAAREDKNTRILTIKVAGEIGGVRSPLSEEVATQLNAYFEEIGDAGVRFEIVNKAADIFNCGVDIYYNAMLTPEDVQSACTAAITAYIENLTFNGEYTNMALIDTLQTVTGVRIAELRSASAREDGAATTTQINTRYTPSAGYFKAGNITLNMQPYE